MAKFTRFDVYLAYAFHLANAGGGMIGGRHTAVVVKSNQIFALGVDEQTHKEDWATAIVNVLQAVAASGYRLKNLDIYSTEEPTQMCIGMAKMAFVRGIYFRNSNGELKRINPSQGPIPQTPYIQKNDKSKVNLITYWDGSDLTNLIHQFQMSAPLSNLQLTRPSVTCGRRATALPNFPWIKNPLNPAGFQRESVSNLAESMFMLTAYALVEMTWNRKDPNGGHNIGSVLVSPQGAILGWAVNVNDDNLTRHGEVNLVKQYLARHPRLPTRSLFYTTLEPCHMCAGMISNAGQGIEVVYGQKDHAISNTALDNNVNSCIQRPCGGKPGASVGLDLSNKQLALSKIENLKKIELQKQNSIEQKLQANENSNKKRRSKTSRQIDPNQMMQTIKFLPSHQAWQSFESASETLFNMRKLLKEEADLQIWKSATDLIRHVQSHNFKISQ